MSDSITHSAPAPVAASKAAPARKPKDMNKPKYYMAFSVGHTKTYCVRLLVCKHPKIGNEEIEAVLKANGLAVNTATIATIANDAKATLRAAVEAKLIKLPE